MNFSTNMPQVRARLNRICDQLRPSQNDLADLVAVFSQDKGDSLLLAFNAEQASALRIAQAEILTLDQLLQDKGKLADFDGLRVAFTDLNLLLPDMATKGPRFYPMEELHSRLGQGAYLPQARLNLAYTLYDKLNLAETPPENKPAAWLGKATRLFDLSLASMLKGHQLKGLIALIPDKNFSDYLFDRRYQLIYIAAPDIRDDDIPLFDLSNIETLSISTARQLCAAFDELNLFNPGIDPKEAGFIDLRKALRRSPYAAQVSDTVHQLAFQCYERAPATAKALAAEYWLADYELDGLIAVEFPPDWPALINDGPSRSYYLTLPESNLMLGPSDPQRAALDNILDPKIQDERHICCLRSLRYPLNVQTDERWTTLDSLLIKLNQPHILARSAFLTARDLRLSHPPRAHLKEAVDEAAGACCAYGLGNPWRWPQGDHSRRTWDSYENLLAGLKSLANISDEPLKSYYRCLGLWWQEYEISETPESTVKKHKELARQIVKKLETVADIEIENRASHQQYPEIYRFYILASAIKELLAEARNPTIIRQRLLEVDFDWVTGSRTVRRRDVFYLQQNPKQPSPLLLVELGQLLRLIEQSHNIRVEKRDSNWKAEQLLKTGRDLGRRIGIDFERTLDNTAGQSYEEIATSIVINPSSLFALPHERLWLACLYASAISRHITLIRNLKARPVRFKAIPDQAIQYDQTKIALAFTHKEGKPASDLEVTLSKSDDYEIFDRLARKKAADSQSVEYNLAFHSVGDVPLQFQYISHNQSFSDELWIRVIELDEVKFQIKQNPYRHGHVITEPNRFYGRRQELRMIFNDLRTVTPGQAQQNFHLRGTRRSGKTSLLQMLRQTIITPKTRRYFHIPPEWDAALNKWHPVYYTLQELPKSSGGKLDSAVFFKALLNHICNVLDWPKEAVTAVLSRFETHLSELGDVVGAAKKELRQILQSLPGDARILILLDELDVIEIEKDDRFFGHLRSIINAFELSRLAWIGTSSRGLYGSQGAFESPLFNVLRTITLRRLDAEEARRQVLEPARKTGIHFLPEAIEHILEQTGRHPYFLQVVCNQVVERLNRAQLTHVPLSLAESAIAGSLQPGTDIYEQCDYLWGPTPGSGKLALSLLAQQEEGLSEMDLRDAFSTTLRRENALQTLSPLKWFAEARKQLLETDLISEDRDGVYHFTIPILRRWLISQSASTALSEVALEEMLAGIKRREDGCA